MVMLLLKGSVPTHVFIPSHVPTPSPASDLALVQPSSEADQFADHLKTKPANTDQETLVSTQISKLLYYHAIASPMPRRKRVETLLSAAA